MDDYVKDYVKKADWRVNENSNTVFSYGGLQNLLSETALAKHALKFLPKRISKFHRKHIFHIHDTYTQGGVSKYDDKKPINSSSCPYCAGWSIKDILLQGLNVDTRFPASKPAKHFGVALGHILNH